MAQLSGRDPADDEPVRLQDAVALFFPAGAMKLSTLRTEARKGRLATIRIGGKDYVTRRDIQDMLTRCREHGSRPASKSEPKAESASGSSGTANGIDAQAALRNRLGRPSKPSPTTSPTASGPIRPNVVRLPSSSGPS